jgi:hypothetical protein
VFYKDYFGVRSEADPYFYPAPTLPAKVLPDCTPMRVIRGPAPDYIRSGLTGWLLFSCSTLGRTRRALGQCDASTWEGVFEGLAAAMIGTTGGATFPRPQNSCSGLLARSSAASGCGCGLELVAARRVGQSGSGSAPLGTRPYEAKDRASNYPQHPTPSGGTMTAG